MCASLRLQAEIVGWDVEAVLSLNRESFGAKGPLEVSSELLVQQASRGELQAVSQILQTGSVHPDVADSQGHTALIAATVTHFYIFSTHSLLKQLFFNQLFQGKTCTVVRYSTITVKNYNEMKK